MCGNIGSLGKNHFIQKIFKRGMGGLYSCNVIDKNKKTMNKHFICLASLTLILSSHILRAQEIETIFKTGGRTHSGAYAAISNKLTTIGGQFANMPEIYGGWFINKKFLLGLEGAATTNYIPVPAQYSESQRGRMSYQYVQFGLMTEYVVASSKKVHVNFNLVTGSGLTLQYNRSRFFDDYFDDIDFSGNPNFFFLMEPGVQAEFNLLKWMRFSPGISYRKTFGSGAPGLSDKDLSNVSYNFTLKFGKF